MSKFEVRPSACALLGRRRARRRSARSPADRTPRRPRTRTARFLRGLVPALGELLRDLEDRRRAAAVVVDPRALDDGVQVRADDDRLLGVALLRVSDARSWSGGSPRTSAVITWTVVDRRPGRSRPAPRRPRRTARAPGSRSSVRRACRRRTSVRPGWPSLKMIAAGRAGSLGVRRLDGEVAGAALHQRDVAGA